MPAIDTYSAGTVTLTNGSAVVTGNAVNWISGGKYNVMGGHWFRYGSFVALIVSVDSATQITLATPFTGTTVAGASYSIFRYTRLETPEAVGLLQALMSKGDSSNPFSRLDIDSGALRASFRDDGAGNLGWYVSASGVADGSQVKRATIDKTSGSLILTSTLGIGVAAPVNGPGLGAHIHGPGGLHLSNATTGNAAFDGSLIYPNGVDLDFYNYETTGKIKFFTNTVERLRLDEVGRAMIATVTAATASTGLTVAGDAGAGVFGDYDGNGQLIIAGKTTPAKRLALGVDTASGTMVGVIQAIESAVAQRSLALNPAGGNVGIGKSSPATKLHVAGEITIEGGNLRGHSATATYTISGGPSANPGGSILLGADSSPVYAGLIFSTAGAQRLLISPGGDVLAGGDNAKSLGGALNRWSVVYAATGTINTSDARAKVTLDGEDITEETGWAVTPFTDAELAAASELAAGIGWYKWKDAVAEKGDAARQHVGFTVQFVLNTLKKHGLDAWSYGFMCRDGITRKVKVKRKQMVQKTEEEKVSYPDIEIRDGVPVRVVKTRVEKRPVTEMVAVLDENGKSETRSVQATEEKTETYPEIEVRDGKPVQVEKKRTVKVPRFEDVPVVNAKGKPIMEEVEVKNGADEEGKPIVTKEKRQKTVQLPVMTTEPVMHAVPVMVEEEVEVEIDEPAGDRLGFRPDQLDRFMMRGLAEKIRLLEAK